MYTKTHERLIHQEIVPLIPQHLKVTLLHEDAIGGEDVYKFISCNVGDQGSSILVFFSSDIEQCNFCQAALREIPQKAISQERVSKWMPTF